FSSRRRHTRFSRDWSSDVCSSDLRRGRACSQQARPPLTGATTITVAPRIRRRAAARPVRLASRSSWRHLSHVVALVVVRGLPVPHQSVLCDLPGVLLPLWADGLPGVG